MHLPDAVIRELRVEPGEAAGLDRRSTSHTAGDWLGPLGKAHPKDVAEEDLAAFRGDLESAQELLYASDTWALLVVFQAPDAAGKDGTIKHVLSGVNPQGCDVHAFKVPSAEELRHDFLWRCVRALPERGRIGIFNRSYYEDVLVVRVHPDDLVAERLPAGTSTGRHLWRERYDDINAFERHLDRSGTRILKFYLHVSREEQKRRLLDRLDDPAKQWKFSAADLAERSFFAAYRQAYEDALAATSTPWAPWYVVPADHKAAMHALVGGVIARAISDLDLHPPRPSPEDRAALDEARRRLESDA